MRKLKEIKLAIILACVSIMLAVDLGGFNSLDASASNAGNQPALITSGVDHSLRVQQPRSAPRKIEGDWEGTLDVGAAKSAG